MTLASVGALDGDSVWARSGIQFGVFAITALATGWLIHTRRTPRITAAFVACCLIPMWGALQLMLGASIYDFATRGAILDSSVYAALFFISIQTFDSRQLRRRLREILFLFALPVSIAALMFPAAKLVNSNQYCILIEITLPLGLYLLNDSAEKKLRYLWVCACACLVASALTSGSRTGSVLITAELIAVPLLLRLRRRGREAVQWRPFAAVFVLVTVFAVGFGYHSLASRFKSHDSLDRPPELVASAINMARDRPWTGFGLGCFQTAYPAYALIDNSQHVNHAHNDWAEWAATGGLPLLAMYLAFFGLTASLMLEHPWAIGAVAMCVHAYFDFAFEVPALAVLSAIVLGAASAGDD